MDPALEELLDGDGGDVLEAMVKLRDPARRPGGFKVVSQFGAIATGRLARRDIRRVWSSPAVHSLKAPRLLKIDDGEVRAPSDWLNREIARQSEERRPGGLRPTGRGVAIGVIDWGLDIQADTFRLKNGSTRIRGLWDQRGDAAAGAGARYGYGRAFSRRDINRALREKRPYEALGYHPGDSAARGGSHGTHVADIALGNGRHGGPVGVAPDAELIFVHLSAGRLGGLANLGDSVRILEAIDYIDRIAGDAPCAINLSLGRHGGAHTGLSLLEQGIDALLASKNDRTIIMSCGNYHMANAHARGALAPGRAEALTWRTEKSDLTVNEVELWYKNQDRFSITLTAPSGDVFRTALGDSKLIVVDGVEVGRMYHRANDPNTPDHHVNIFLKPTAPHGDWRIGIEAESIVDGRYHAWVERDSPRPGAQSRFAAEDADATHTTGSICNGFLSIACGAANLRGRRASIARFSSEGPTRDGRQKPDIVAPGVSVVAASSAPRGAEQATNALTRKSGASQAAPYAAGVAALVYEAAGRSLSIHDMRRALIGTARDALFDPAEAARFGAGLVDAEAAVASIRSDADRKTGGRQLIRANSGQASAGQASAGHVNAGDLDMPSEPFESRIQSFVDQSHLDVADTGRGAAAMFDDIVFGRGGESAFLDVFEVVAMPGDSVAETHLLADDFAIRRGLADGAVAEVHRGESARRLLHRQTLPRNTLLLRRRTGHVASEASVAGGRHVCAAGDGPPAALPDPEGRGLHPLVYRGTGRLRSRNPTVGDAQQLLNNFLQQAGPALSTCQFANAAAQSRAHNYLMALNAAGQNPLVVDCQFGSNTDRATRIFQLCNNINEDGKIGPVTWRLLEPFRALRPVIPPITPPGPPFVPPVVPPAPPGVLLNPPRWEPILRGAFRASPALHAGNAVKFYIDGEDTFLDMVRAIQSARNENHYIYLLGWRLVDNFDLAPGVPPINPCITKPPHRAIPRSSTLELFTDASNRGVQVRAILWDQLGRANSAEVGRINRMTNGAAILDDETGTRRASHHQKVLVVKGDEGLIGFCGGVDINNDRIQASGGTGPSSPLSGGGSPLHDVHCRVIGPSVHDLLTTFINRWRHHPDHTARDRSKGALRGLREPRPAPVASVTTSTASVPRSCSVAIARTFRPRHRVPGIVRECDIRALLLASIGAAQKFIYMEDQYLISEEAARALNRAIPRLQHLTILIASSQTSVELVCPWELRRNFIRIMTSGLSPADRAKIRIFQRIDPSAGVNRFTGRHTKIHSKLWIFDDELAVIGSANCNRRGWESDSEANAFIFDDAGAVERNPISPGNPSFAQALRMELWAEHLVMPASTFADGAASVTHWDRLPAGACVERYNPSGGRGASRVCTTQLRRTRDIIVDPPAPCP